MVFQMVAFGPHALQKLSSAEFPDDPPVSRLQMPDSPDVDEEDDVDVAGEARPCRLVGTAEVNCDNAACVLVLADVPVAWVTAAACPANPPGAVVCGAAANAGTLAAAADWPA